MACPIPRSGKNGFVGDYTGNVLTRFRRVRNWTYNEVANPEERRYAGLRFGTQRIPGFVDHTGSFQGFGAVPPLFAGDEFTFIGYTAPTTGVPCTPGCAFSVPALVDSVAITWNWTAENKGVNWTVNFSATEPETVIPSFVDNCDDNVYCDENPCDLIFQMYDPCDNDALIEWCNIVSATLVFTSSNHPFSNNSTNCTIKRDIGNLDWTLEVVDENPCRIPLTQKSYWFRIGATVNPLTYWQLKWGMNVGLSNFTVDIENGNIISKQNNFAMQAVLCCTSGAVPNRGALVNPSGLTVWPYSVSS